MTPGSWSITWVADRDLALYLPTGRQFHNQHWKEQVADPGAPSEEATEAWGLKTRRQGLLRAAEGDRGDGL